MLVLDKVKTPIRAATITSWYEEAFPLVAAYIRRRGGDLENAREIFQEAIVLYYEKCVNDGFRSDEEDSAYLMGIAKKLWLKHYARSAKNVGMEQVDVAEENEKGPIGNKLLQHLKQTGERCLDLLQSFYYEKLTMHQVADRFGYSGERSATVQKFKCLEKVRDEVKRKSMSYEDFLE